ncbi:MULTISPECIES: hypothetical protein [unclassified Beijerinckia]|uniref:hypothetical protein n=1 Tax=unclassified Beijerinckia TaxID=2638183 RepID=UPI00089CA17D|nr:MULTISPECIES: hypothetical protein [unclassified Beijerinckia]MDH7797729.1 hypothetical protein [Beijerinckia sp. GAS462]SEC96577.1 hypothetical protein SAMN05443249_4022 [Beijerinckia sp. 28-YEA-48]
MKAKAFAYAVPLALSFVFVCADVAQAQGHRKSIPPTRSYQTRLPGLQFYGEPYGWTTPMARGGAPAEVARPERYREAVSVYRPTDPSSDLSGERAMPTHVTRTRLNNPLRAPEVREQKRPSGVAQPKATRVIPLFNVPEDQQ